MTAAEHFAALERRTETSKEAYRIVAHTITDWLSEYALLIKQPNVSVEVRVELERIRDAMAAAGQVPTPQETISGGGTPP